MTNEMTRSENKMRNCMTSYRVTKRFVSGLLAGITITEITSVKFDVGFVCANPVGGSPYEVIAVEVAS